MASDLPFDDEEEVAERGGDAAYRIASATARVARGGAYVTGGALIAANGGGVPASPEEVDSRNTGWAHNVDPDPDVPSPVVTFPDPEPVAPQDMPFGSPGDASVTMPLPNGTFDIQIGRPGEFGFEDLGSYDAPYMDQVPGLELIPGGPEGDFPGSGFVPETPGTGVPESNIPGLPELGPPEAPGGMQGFDGIPGLGGDIPGLGGGFPGAGNEGPGAPGGFELPAPGDAFKTDIFDLPGFGLNPAGQPKAVAQTTDSGPSGWDFGVSDLLGGARADTGGSGDDGAWFEFSLDTGGSGFAGLALGGAGGSVQVESDMGVDISVGSGGIRVDSEWDFGIAADDAFSLDDQLDQYTGWMQAGATESPSGAGQPGVAEPGRPVDVDAVVTRDDAAIAMGGNTGTGTGAASAQNAAVPAGTAGPATSGMSVAPAAAPAPLPSAPTPVAVAPVAPPAPVAVAPMAPVAPAPVPPPVAPAPVPPPVAPAAVVPAVQPVAATPLQTTVQPDVATSPVAHVFQAPAGPSPLTAPAAELPDLFHRPPQPVQPDLPTAPVLPGDSLTVLPTTTAPVTTSDSVATTPDTTTTGPDGSTTTGPSGTTSNDGSTTSVGGSTTLLPGVTTSPQDSTTSPDGSTTPTELTETGGSSPTSASGESSTATEGSTTGESGGVTTTAPGSSTGGSGSTTEPIGGGTGAPSTGDQTSDTAPSTVDLPTQQIPTVDQSAPEAPTMEQPQVPTVSMPAQQPSMPDAQLPTMPQTMPTPVPAPQVKPIAEHGAVVVPYDVHGVATATPYTDHTVLGFAGGELTGDQSAGFMPHTVTVAEDPVPDPAFWVYF